jgi:ribokinase
METRMAEEPLILVVGSINMDLVVKTPRMAAPGETILGSDFKTSPGGKGANQAVGVARLGGNCAMIGCVGKDTFGEPLLNNLREEGIDCAGVTVTEDAPSGVAMIVVDSKGENSIVVAGGANHLVTPDDHIYPHEELFRRAALVLLQLELPMATVHAAIDLARRHGCKIVLDPAPAPIRMPEEFCMVDILTPNVTEAEQITGRKAGSEERVDKQIASDLIALGAKAAVLKLGPRGSLAVTADGDFYTTAAYKVNVVDTTAAGDAFTAALAVAIARGDKLRHAAQFANAAGALACTTLGAQAAMPHADEVKLLMQDQPS